MSCPRRRRRHFFSFVHFWIFEDKRLMQLTQKDYGTNVQLAQIGKNAQKNIDRKSGGNMCTRKLIEFTKTS